jgi:hypothetical protein
MMRELSYTFQPLLAGAVVVTAKLVVRKGGDEIWLCDVFEELKAAMDEGVPFVAHRVIGLKPVELIVNPANVATIEREVTA